MDLFSNAETIELERKIPMYAKAYYEGAALISDAEFDALVDRLRELDPNSKILHTPGWGYVQTGSKVNHRYQIVKSLDKCKTFEEVPERFTNKVVAISPKLDGLTGVFYYVNGKLDKAVTRGDGEKGKDITDKARIIVGDSIRDTHFTGGVRGELEISKSNWERIKDKYPEAKNARNLCAGWINSKEYDPEEIKLIDFVTYKVTGQERELGREHIFFDLLDDKEIHTLCANTDPTKFDVIDWLSYNFKSVIPKVQATLQKEGFDELTKKIFDNFIEEGDYELDGLVISNMDVLYNRMYNSYVYDECAFKFASETAVTVVEDIVWELSRTQRYIPVLKIKPVFLAGAEIQNITGNNAKYLVENGLGIGAEIEMCRSGEVIPKHLNTLEPADTNLPEVCPICGSKLEWVGVDLKCINSNCANIKLSDLQLWCETIGETDGFAWLLMKQYLDVYHIDSLEKLYTQKDRILTDYNNMQLSITDKKALQFYTKLFTDKVDVEKALIALNIPRIGEKTAKVLSRNSELCKSTFESMVTGYGISPENIRKMLELVGDATTNSVIENLSKLMNIRYILDRIQYKEQTQQEVIKVAVTGGLNSMKRSAFEKYIEGYGYELSSSLKSCKYLITNNPNSGSSKNKDAQKYGVEIITELDFLDLIGGNKPQSNTLF